MPQVCNSHVCNWHAEHGTWNMEFCSTYNSHPSSSTPKLTHNDPRKPASTSLQSLFLKPPGLFLLSLSQLLSPTPAQKHARCHPALGTRLSAGPTAPCPLRYQPPPWEAHSFGFQDGQAPSCKQQVSCCPSIRGWMGFFKLFIFFYLN